MHLTQQMRRWGVVVVLGVTLATAFAPIGAKPKTAGVRHRVDIQRFTFAPASLVVAPGDTVVWVNLDLVPHTVTAKDESWGSQALQSNETWEMRVPEEMTDTYFCRYHPAMEGQVQMKRH